MVFLTNIVPMLIVIFGMLFVYLTPRWRNKSIAIIATLFLTVIYTQVQPSYMPKGTVKALPNAEFKVVDKHVVDLLLKPKSSEQYDAERNAALEAIDQSIHEQIKLNKE